jgi:hypothetical protein
MTDTAVPHDRLQPHGLKPISWPAVFGELAVGAAEGVDRQTREAQLHLSRERLEAAPATAVVEADRPGTTIVPGHGLCSNGVRAAAYGPGAGGPDDSLPATACRALRTS